MCIINRYVNNCYRIRNTYSLSRLETMRYIYIYLYTYLLKYLMRNRNIRDKSSHLHCQYRYLYIGTPTTQQQHQGGEKDIPPGKTSSRAPGSEGLLLPQKHGYFLCSRTTGLGLVASGADHPSG